MNTTTMLRRDAISLLKPLARKKIAKVYDQGDVALAIFTLLPSFEYPEWDWRTVGEFLKAYKAPSYRVVVYDAGRVSPEPYAPTYSVKRLEYEFEPHTPIDKIHAWLYSQHGRTDLYYSVLQDGELVAEGRLDRCYRAQSRYW